jgi:hypothetical protein
MISGRKVCVHDEVWKECEVRLVVLPQVEDSLRSNQGGHEVDDFVRRIHVEYERLNRWVE